MEIYIIICKIDSQWEFAVWLRKLKQGLCIKLEGWNGEGDGVSKGRRYMYQFSSVTQSCPTLCSPVDCSMIGFPVLYYLLEFLILMSTESVMPSNHLIFCHPLLLPSIFPSIRVFSNESALHIRAIVKMTAHKCW